MAKLFKSWAYNYDEEKEEITILIQNYDGEWGSIATVGDCPKGDLTDQEFDEKYNNLLTEVIDEQGWESVWTHGMLTRIVKELDGIWHNESDICEQFWEDEDDFADEENRQYFDDEFDEDLGNWREVIGDCPVVVTGVLGLWDGPHEIVPTRVRNLSEAVYKCLEGLNSIYEDKKGNLCIDAHHHDGCNHFKIMKYKDPNRPSAGVKPMNYLGRR